MKGKSEMMHSDLEFVTVVTISHLNSLPFKSSSKTTRTPSKWTVHHYFHLITMYTPIFKIYSVNSTVMDLT